jgi:hypothetical protein
VTQPRKSHRRPSAYGKLQALASRVREGGAADELIVAVVEGSSVAVRKVPRPANLRRRGVARGAYADYVARRLAEIDSAVADLLAAAGGSAESAAVGFTAEEEKALKSGGLSPAPLKPGEEAPLTQTALEYAHLLQSSLSVAEAAELLDVNRSRVRQRLIADPPSLYGIKEGKSWRLPRFQFAGRKPVPGIGLVIAALPRNLHPVAVVRWFTTPHQDLRTGRNEERKVAPLDWLRAGKEPAVVADLARDL